MRYNRRVLYPAPVVVDADVLIRDVQYALTTGHLPRRLRSASREYSIVTGVALFATRQVISEAVRHLPDVAGRAGVSESEVRMTWNREVIPRIRVVEIDEHTITDPRVAQVRELHASDAPTAALAALLAPAVLLTDNRKHFAPFGMPSTKSDVIAGDAVTLSKFGIGVRGAMLVPTIGAIGVADGSKKAIARLGKDGAALVGLLAAAGFWRFMTSTRGRSTRARLSDLAREAGPPLAAMIGTAVAAGERVGEFAVRRVDDADALAAVARLLAVGQSVMTTSEVTRELRQRGFRFENGARFETHTRAWLVEQSCFHELSRGHWSFGYHAAELPVGV